ncbi:MAG: hypothetical protein IKH38_02605 [Clostridia bacterium]|nr:hypothetical protein [Clostridia bacterium]
MLAILYLLPYLVCGGLIVRWLLPRCSPLTRLWLGGSLGVLLLMWLPTLCAFGMRFSVAAHMVALIPLALLTLGSRFGKDARTPRGWDAEEISLLKSTLIVLIPFTILFVFLQVTHVYRVDGRGNWVVGQSTFGDLPMHTAFITGLRNAAFPPEYPIFPGHRLTYPFLADSLSTTFLLLGMSLQAATVVPAVLMGMLLCTGLFCLLRPLTRGRRCLMLAVLLFLLNGGLGFLYDFDQAGGLQEGSWVPNVWERIMDILSGYYTTPTNQPEPNNLRWSNLIVDLFVPQRTLLGGYTMVLPCFYLLWTSFRTSEFEKQGNLRAELLLAVWAGSLPLIHTHSFLALGLCSAGFLLYDLIHGENRRDTLLRYLRYAGITLLLAAPQLVCFTFYQALGQQPDTLPPEYGGFLRLQFNWVNNPGGRGMRDFYLWFYLKNIGLPFAILLLAVFEPDKLHRRLLSGAGVIWLTAELVRFQPNEYDNNKLFYLAWLLCCPVIADFAFGLWDRLKGLRARPLIAIAAIFMTFCSAALTLARECVSPYQLFTAYPSFDFSAEGSGYYLQSFSAGDVQAAHFIEEHTPEGSVFLTGYDQLQNPVASIAGRTIVCGTNTWLFYHGFDTREAHADIARFYGDPAANLDVLQKYQVDYVYVSAHEYNSEDYEVDPEALDRLFPRIYSEGWITIWEVPVG